jgi:UDP-glucose 4-epimerase
MILVTGATGYVGSNFIQNSVYDLKVISRKPLTLPQRHKFVFLNEISSRTDWSSILQGVEIVVHIAGLAHVNKFTDKERFIETNTNATRNLAIQSSSHGVKKFIYISSVSVFGPYTGFPFTEESNCFPSNLYSHSKLNAENELVRVCNTSEMNYTIIRPPLIYGHGAPGNCSKIYRFLKYKLPLPFSNIKNKRSFIHIENLVSFINHCLKNDKSNNLIFNISDDIDISSSQFISLIASINDLEYRLFPIPSKLSNILFCNFSFYENLYTDYIISCRRSRNLLSWSPSFNPLSMLK